MNLVLLLDVILDSLQEALDKTVLLDIDELPVVKAKDPDKIVAMISKRDIIDYYHARAGRVGPSVS